MSNRIVGQNKKYISRHKYETLLSKHKRTLKEINELKNKGVLTDQHWVFTLEDVEKIAEWAVTAGWKDALNSAKDNSRHRWEYIMEIRKKHFEKPFR